MPLFPFHVYAESVGGSSPIIGVNITYIGYDGEVVPYQTTVRFNTEQTMWRCTSSHSTMGCQVWESENINGSTLDEITGTITTNATSTYTYRLYQYEFIFDKTYVGSITFNGNHPGATTTTTYYINGNRLVLTDINLVTSFTISSYNLTYAPLETISQLRMYDIPYESYKSFLTLTGYGNELYDYSYLSEFYYNYPLFKFTSSKKRIFNFSDIKVGDELYFVIMWSYNKAPSGNNSFTTSNNGTLQRIAHDTIRFAREQYTYLLIDTYKFTVSSTNPTYFYLDFNLSGSEECIGFPIYIGYAKDCSTDFCLNYGLRNEILDNLNIIAQGTQASSSSSSDLEDSADDIVQNSSTMFQFENQQNTNMNNALQSINTNFDIGSIGSSFLTSAAWVKTQFDNLTNFTPFGSVLSFSLLLGLALLIIGKVYK